MSFLELKNIHYNIDKTKILNSINLNINENEFFSILGPSGVGKTTIFRIITGALSAQEGLVLLDGKKLNDLPMEKREIIMVHQSKQLFPHLTLVENIQFGMKLRKMDKWYIKEKTDYLLKMFNMEEHLNKYPHELSGGQQQLTALMRAAAVNPKVLLLDEPFTGLDNNLKIYMRNFILQVQKKLKITIVMITHDKEDAFYMSDKIAFIFNGRIVLTSTPQDLCKKTNIDEVDDFLGEIILLNDGKVVFNDKILNIKK